MKIPRLAPTVLVTLVLACSGCGASIKKLSEEQDKYYTKLEESLNANQALLRASMETQLVAHRERERTLAEWTRKLQKADVLLQQDETVTGQQRLLSWKLAELDLAVERNEHAMEQVDGDRLKAILDLYGKILEATQALKKNSKAVTAYLGGGLDSAVASLDIGAVVSAISGIRQVQENLGKIEGRSEEERKKESDRIQKGLERAQDLLGKVLKKKSG